MEQMQLDVCPWRNIHRMRLCAVVACLPLQSRGCKKRTTATVRILAGLGGIERKGGKGALAQRHAGSRFVPKLQHIKRLAASERWTGALVEGV